MKDKQNAGSWRTAWECLLASLAMAVLTLVSFRLHAGPAMAALLFFFLVILISLWAGFLSTALACAVAALCFVYFFTQPLYHLWMSEPVEIAATVAFSGTALIISRLISRVRERTAEVHQTNEQLQAEIAERKRAEEKTRQSEAELRQLIDAIPQQVFVFDANWNPLFANQREREYTGLTPQEAQSKDAVAKIFHPEDLKKLEVLRERMSSEGAPFEMEARIRDREGQYRWFLIRDNPLRDEQGRILRWYGTRTDIEDRKRAEEALHRLNRELRALSNCNQTLLRATDEQSLLHEICRIVCEEAGYRAAWVGYAEPNEAKSVRPVAWTGTEEGDVANLGITWADTERGRGIIGTAIRSGNTCCIKDYATDPEVAPWRESALQHGFRSAIALPLKDEHANIFGSLNIYSAQPNAFTSEEIRLLEELAADLAFGIVTRRSRAAREQAEQEVALLSFAVDRVREAAFLMDDSGRFQYANEEACHVLGYTRAQLLGMGVADIDPEFPGERWSDHWRDLQAQRSLGFESRHRTRDGHTIPVEVSANYFEYGGRAYNLALVRDITERKRAEETLEKERKRMEVILSALNTGLSLINPDMTIDWVNQKIREMFPVGEPVGQVCHAFYESRETICEGCGTLQAFSSGKVVESEQLVPSVGRWYYIISQPIKDTSGRVVNVLEGITDITERKRAEEKIRQQEMELRQVLDFAPQLVAVFGHDRKRLYANQPTLDYFGVTLEEWLSISDRFWFYHPDDRERMARDVYTGLASDSPHEFEARLRRKDGAYRWFLFRDNPLRDEQGRITRWYLTATDIEDRKRAEEERQARVWFLESMDRVNRAMQGTNDLEQMTGDVIDAMLSIFESDRAFLYYPCDPDAPSFEVVMARTRPEYPAARGVIPMTPDTASGFQIVRASSGVVTFGPGCDYPLIGGFAKRFGHQSSIGIALYPKTGQPWVLTMHQCSYPRVWTAEERKLLEEIARRLTDSLTSLLMFRSLRENEEALRLSEAYLASAQKLTHTGAYAMNGTSREPIYWSEGMFRLFGTDPKEGLLRRDQVWQRIHPEDHDKVQAASDRVFLEKVDSEVEYRIVLPDGTVKLVHTQAHPVLSANGEVAEVVATIVDITERERAEEALRAQAALLDLTHDTVFVMDMEGVIKYWNRGAEERYGWAAEQALGRVVHDLLKTVFPGPREEIRAEVSRTGRWEGEILHTKKDGTQVVVASRWALQRDERGAPLAILETNNDITLRKRAEEALRLSNAYNRSLIEASPDPLVTIGPDGKITDVNAATEAATGRSRGELVGTDFCDYFTEPSKARAGYEQVFREGMVRDYPLELRHRDGGVMSVLYNASVYRDVSGRVTGVFAAARDITERQRAEEALRESEQRFRTFVDHAADALFIYDFEQGTIVDVNRQACESLGYTRQELIGTTLLAYDRKVDRAVRDSMAERTAAGETVIDTHWHQRKDGTLFPVEAHTSQYWYGGRRFLLKVARDITDRLQAEEQRERLRQLEADLAHTNRVSTMGELAASIAHEVNQPLSGVVVNANACLRWMAGDSPNLDEAREAVRRIVRDGKRAGDVIARIRALATKTATDKERLDMNEAIREVVAFVQGEVRKNRVEVRREFAPDLSPVLGDRVQLQQVVLNLVMNGVEAMSSVEGRPRELIVRTQNDDAGQVRVTVQDSGMGLDPQSMERMFEAFYTTKQGGMGMGLSISRSIIQNHGGKLWAVANEGPGISVQFTIPRYQ